MSYDSFRHFKDAVGASKKELQDLLLSISSCSVAIKGTFLIWTGRNHAKGCTSIIRMLHVH